MSQFGAIEMAVRIQDVVNPDDINIYRQLAGGVTAMNQLHGSATDATIATAPPMLMPTTWTGSPG